MTSPAAQEADRQVATLLQAIARRNPALLSAVRIGSVGYREVRKALPPGRAMVVFFSTDKGLYRWVFTGDREEATLLPLGKDALAAQCRDLNTRIRHLAPVEEAAGKLGDLLLSDVVADLQARGVTRLVVVPHGPLFAVPPGVWRVGERYLADLFTVSELPDAGMLADGRPMTPLGKDSSVLAAGYRPAPGSSLPDLPLVDQELDRLSDAFVQARVLSGLDARPEALTAGMGGRDLVHVAAHMTFDPAQPFDGALHLAPGQQGGDRLTLREIFSLPASQVGTVVLSGCQGQESVQSSGGAVISLGHALAYLGVKAVVASRMSVDDLSTAVLMKHLHRSLASGMDAAQALQQAQAHTRRLFAHPAYWASFSVIGY